MKPLHVEASLLKLSIQHPDSTAFRDAVGSGSALSRESLVRLWLTEGIPFAFLECPAIYEATRSWLGSRLQICPKEITLLGSARLGFSLRPPPNFGQAFSPDSDLDFAVVSPSLFQDLSKTFHKWHADYRENKVQPRHPKERQYWDQNVSFGLTNLPKGFLDANKIPTLDRYHVAQNLNQVMWELMKKLEATIGAPKPAKTSLRVYNSWRALVARVSFNLKTALVRR